jgi:hypothetical protein
MRFIIGELGYGIQDLIEPAETLEIKSCRDLGICIVSQCTVGFTRQNERQIRG